MIQIEAGQLGGSLRAIPSKSYAHRALIAGALAEGVSEIYFHESSEDIDYTIGILKELGARIEKIEGGLRIGTIEKKNTCPRLDLGESGTSFRLILPVATALYDTCQYRGKGRLADRPIKDLLEALQRGGVHFDSDRLPFTSRGKLKASSFELPGDVSSQYVSGLLFAAPLLEGRSEIILKSALESRAYVDITIEVLRDFGIEIEEHEGGYSLTGQAYRARNYQVEGDWSNSAFFLMAGALGQEVRLSGLKLDSSQGDRKILEILRELGAFLEVQEDEILVRRDRLQPIEVDLREIPDALPILAVGAAAVDGGVSRFYNGKRLRLKESDRLASVARMISDLGGRVVEKEEEILVYGTGGLRGGKTESFGDHRLVMAAAIASAISQNPISIENPQAVCKSYPKFFEDFIRLGGDLSGKYLW